MIRSRLLTASILLTSAVPAFTAPAKYEQMDYGRFLSATYLTQERKVDGKSEKGKSTLETQFGCATNKGIAVKLGNNEGGMLFDTDLCRMSGGWSGGYVKYKGVVFDGGHGPNPGPADNATMFFQINPGPGWSKGDEFADPRKLPSGPGAAKIPFGPLPREWARYRGLYLHGDNVVFTYTVGTAGVMEMPAWEGDLLTRTLNVVAGGDGASVVLADGPEGTTASVENGVGLVANDSLNPDSRVVVTVLGLPENASIVANGARLILKFTSLTQGTKVKIAYARATAADVAAASEALKKAAPATDLAPFKSGGPAHWPEVVTTKGTLGSDEGPYALDTLTVPFENPYKSWMRIGGMDFFKDGKSAAVCTWSGDVWIVSGIDAKLENLKWKRYATGIFQALGLKIVDEKIYVLGRDQITRLSDLNGDNEADWYETFNNDVQVTPGFHEFTFDLQTDSKGNFYFTKAGPVNPGGSGWGPLGEHNGCILKVSKDGTKFEVFATGVRAPNGMGVGPGDVITVGDNQGTWVPACYVHIVKPGDFITVADLAHRPEVPTNHTPHICYFPMAVDNSGGGQTWVTSDRWGPLKGMLLHCSYGQSSLLGVIQEKVGDVVQGGAFRFPFKLDSGAMRPRFNAADGQLYIAGLKGWQTNGAKDACFQRVRYTGKPVTLPQQLKVTDKGITIGFTGPLDTAMASDVQNYSIEQWNYRWTKGYGSPDFKVTDPNEKGRDPVEIKSAQVNPDRKSVFLEIPGLKPVDQMQIKMNLKSADGAPLPDKITNTINVVGREAAPAS